MRATWLANGYLQFIHTVYTDWRPVSLRRRCNWRAKSSTFCKSHTWGIAFKAVYIVHINSDRACSLAWPSTISMVCIYRSSAHASQIIKCSNVIYDTMHLLIFDINYKTHRDYSAILHIYFEILSNKGAGEDILLARWGVGVRVSSLALQPNIWPSTGRTLLMRCRASLQDHIGELTMLWLRPIFESSRKRSDEERCVGLLRDCQQYSNNNIYLSFKIFFVPSVPVSSYVDSASSNCWEKTYLVSKYLMSSFTLWLPRISSILEILDGPVEYCLPEREVSGPSDVVYNNFQVRLQTTFSEQICYVVYQVTAKLTPRESRLSFVLISDMNSSPQVSLQCLHDYHDLPKIFLLA